MKIRDNNKIRNAKNLKAESWKSEAGFTMVEVLVAISLFTLAVTGVISAAVQGGTSINMAKNRLAANYIAHEGIELVRAKRDSYVLGASSFAAGWTDFSTVTLGRCNSAGPCDIDISGATTPTAPDTAVGGLVYYSCPIDCTLNYDASSSGLGYYSHGAGTPSIFSRRITVISVGTDELQVTSTVTWREGGVLQTIKISESLFNWY